MKTLVKSEDKQTISISELFSLHEGIYPLIGLKLVNVDNYNGKKFILTVNKKGRFAFANGLTFWTLGDSLYELLNNVVDDNRVQVFVFNDINEMAKWITEDK